MQQLETLEHGGLYRIIQEANGKDALILEQRNRKYFRQLIERHIDPVGKVISFRLWPNQLELLVRFYAETEVPERYRNRLYQPLSNLFNAYAKSINKRYNRKGSLFRARFSRERLE